MKQAVRKFCTELRDREAARLFCLQRHSSLDDVIQYVKRFQHCDQPVFGKSNRERDTDEDEVQVYEASTAADNKK